MLDSDGHAISPQPISRTDPSTTRGKRGLDMAAPEVQRAAGIKPLLLADNGEYTFGRARDPAKQARVDQAHAEYRELLDRCAIETEEPAVLAVKRFYERGGADQLTLGRGLRLRTQGHLRGDTGGRRASASDRLARSAGVLARVEHIRRRRRRSMSRVRRIEASARSPAGEDQGDPWRPALGDVDHLRQLLGVRVVRLKASRIAPTCRECGESFTRALNSLLADERGAAPAGGGSTAACAWIRRSGARSGRGRTPGASGWSPTRPWTTPACRKCPRENF